MQAFRSWMKISQPLVDGHLFIPNIKMKNTLNKFVSKKYLHTFLFPTRKCLKLQLLILKFSFWAVDLRLHRHEGDLVTKLLTRKKLIEEIGHNRAPKASMDVFSSPPLSLSLIFPAIVLYIYIYYICCFCLIVSFYCFIWMFFSEGAFF